MEFQNRLREISWGDRWQVYRRLQELAIPCECGTNQPLRYQLQDVTAAIQLWSVVRQLTVPRQGTSLLAGTLLANAELTSGLFGG
jgi:hypothetical protein